MTERLWCLACGTVTSDMLCDCNRWPDGHEMKREPNFVNYADEMQKTAHEQAQQIETLVNALRDILRECDEAQTGAAWAIDVRKIANEAIATLSPADRS